MAINVLSAARYLCEISGWNLSNLKLQKLLFLSHMVHLGEHNSPLTKEGFEAWDYGPVSPVLYRHVKAFGSEPIKNVFHAYSLPLDNSTEASSMRSVYDQVGNLDAGRLVSITHRKFGAWNSVYRSNTLGIPIPNRLILKEYESLKANQGSDNDRSE